MIHRKRNYFFITHFYRWDLVVLFIIIGTGTLWFYFQALTGICRYPLCFPLILFGVNIILLIVSTLLIRLPGRPEIKKNIHSAVMFILLIVNPGLIVAFSETFLSILWALSISTFLLYCLLFIRFRKKDVRITTVPFFTFLMHFLYRVANGKMETDILFLALFGFLMSCFYALFYHMFKFCLDNNHESLSVYLDNNEIAEFLEGYRLTCREQEICSCIINGYSAKTTAEKLSIAEGTVKNHTKKIYRKIGINGRMELMHLVWDFSLLKK